MARAHPPELKKHMDKKIRFQLNGKRTITGVLRGFDPFMNLVVDEGIEHRNDGSTSNIGMVVIRGNSVIRMEALEKII